MLSPSDGTRQWKDDPGRPRGAGRRESVYNNKSIVNLVCQVHQTTSSNGRMTLVDPEAAGRRESVYNNKSDGAFLTVRMETVLVDGSN